MTSTTATTTETLYSCTIHRDGRQAFDLLSPRTSAEVAHLRVTHPTWHVEATPIIPINSVGNKRKPNAYSRALVACSDLFSHAGQTGDVELQARAGKAISALLKNSGLSADDDLPSSTKMKVAPPSRSFADVTLPGLGKR
jgi:hypothetical protein